MSNRNIKRSRRLKKPDDKFIKITKEEFISERTRIISEMLDNPDELGIYPTTKCFEELDALFDKIIRSGGSND